MRKQPEHDEQVKLIQWARWNEGKHKDLHWLHAIPNGGQRHPAVAAKLQAEGVKPGVFDLCLPVARNGFHGLYIEMKAGKGRVTDEQKSFEAHLVKSGYQAVVCWSGDAAIEAVSDYLGIKS